MEKKRIRRARRAARGQDRHDHGQDRVERRRRLGDRKRRRLCVVRRVTLSLCSKDGASSEKSGWQRWTRTLVVLCSYRSRILSVVVDASLNDLADGRLPDICEDAAPNAYTQSSSYPGTGYVPQRGRGIDAAIRKEVGVDVVATRVY